jgi:hypothetical protein
MDSRHLQGVREPNTGRIESNQSGKRLQPTIETTPVRFVVSVNPNVAAGIERKEVDRTVTKNLIGLSDPGAR